MRIFVTDEIPEIGLKKLKAKFDVTVGGLKFDTWESTINNTGDTVLESSDFKAESVIGMYFIGLFFTKK